MGLIKRSKETDGKILDPFCIGEHDREIIEYAWGFYLESKAYDYH